MLGKTPVATSPFCTPLPVWVQFQVKKPESHPEERSRLTSLISAALWHPETPTPLDRASSTVFLKTR